MRPAFSVLFLTTLIGAGQGMLVALVAGQWYLVIGTQSAPKESGAFYAIGSLIALGFLGLGLFASFFHLANPQRAWRSAARWRTSWLSREVILLPAVMGLAVIYGGVHALGWDPVLMTFGNQKSLDLTMAAGFLVAGTALLLFVATGMIYACVKFIREWATVWTVVNYTVLGLASGFTLAAAYAATMGSLLEDFLAWGALLLVAAALATRSFHLWRNTRLGARSTMKSAIGVHHREIRQITQGFMGASFNTQEFFHPCRDEALRGLTAFFLVAAFVVPALLVAWGWQSGQLVLLWAAFAAQGAGLLAERWVFFASGRHVQNLYYQAKA